MVNMGRAIEMGQREQLIALKKQGFSLCAISEQLHLSYGTVSKLSARLRRKGNLQVAYSNCGPKQPTSDAQVISDALRLRTDHPQWGAPFIRVKLLEAHPPGHIPGIRTLQRWFRKQGLTKLRQRTGQPSIGKAKAPHNIWQVDAKENLSLADGQQACYLSIVDEHSGAGLETLVFPPQADRTGADGGGQKTAHRSV